MFPILGISWIFIIPTDELHHFSEGNHQPVMQTYVLMLREVPILCVQSLIFSGRL